MLEWKFGLDIISLAVEKTTSRPNANFDYLNGILKSWHDAGYASVEQIQKQDVKPRRARADSVRPGAAEPARRNNFDQRTYDDAFFDKLSGAALKAGSGEGGNGS
jgi:DNA replication protein DnaD